jgi:uncharacterized SAM-binding protein YcdF (DUF218 family)/lysophospholipase L1-like esterase
VQLTDPAGKPAWRRAFLAGIFVGVVLVFVGREIIEETVLVDLALAPLLDTDTPGSADVIVALGASVTQLCTPNPSGIHRTLLAAELYHRGRAPIVLFTGGRPSGESCSIAETMAALARRVGVPADRIRTETSSQSTLQNAERSDAVLRTLGARRILLVTDRPHLRRAAAVFRRFGYVVERAGVPVPLSHANNTHYLFMGAREYLASALYWLRGYTDERPAETALVTPVVASIQENRSTAMTMDTLRFPNGPLVILGASYAKGWTPAVDGVQVINAGVAGQQSFEMLARFEADVVSRQPRAVVLWGFINDVFRSPRPNIAAALTRVRESFGSMVEQARRQGIEPILATEVTAGAKAGWKEAAAGLVGGLLGKQAYHEYVNRHVMDTNAWLRELARREGLLLLDFEQVVTRGSSGQRLRAYTADDGSHLTPAAYEALSAYAAPILRARYASPAQPR